MPNFGMTPEEKKGLLYGALISAALRGAAGASRGEGGIGSVIGGAATGFGAYGAGLGHLTDYKRLLQEEQNKQYMFPATMEHMQAQTGRLKQETETQKAMMPYMQEYEQARIGATKALTEQRGQPHVTYLGWRNSLASEARDLTNLLNNPMSGLSDAEIEQTKQEIEYKRGIIRQLDQRIGPILFQEQAGMPTPNQPLSLHTSPSKNPKANMLNFINR